MSLIQLSLSSPSSFAPIKSRMETFWYQLTQVHPEKWLLKWRVGDKPFQFNIQYLCDRHTELQIATAYTMTVALYGQKYSIM